MSEPTAICQGAGQHWSDHGYSAVSGDLLGLLRALDRCFVRIGEHLMPAEYEFAPFIAASELAKLDYFRSFPQLVTFPTALEKTEENLAAFVASDPCVGGEVTLTKPAPIRDVLAPAACYHFYVLLQGRGFAEDQYFTTRATCFRREASYTPLRRQWSFPMRELVCVGSRHAVESFLADSRARIDRWTEEIGLRSRLKWAVATDPFFDPRSAGFIAQKVQPLKHELVFDGSLAIGSINFHRTYFGEAFAIKRDGEAAHSGCVAFGLTRWLFAVLQAFGGRRESWPIALDR